MISVLLVYTNMLLFSVNDILDFKLIEENNMMPKIQTFSLKDTFEFALDIIQQTTLDSQ